MTILNKLKREDSPNGLDAWFKTVIDNGAWYQDIIRNVDKNGVYIGNTLKVLIPFNDSFSEYKDWKTTCEGYTISKGDYIILGDIEETEITPNNVTKIAQKYSDNICLVKHFRINYNRFGATVQLKIEGI